jgi:hypothetical protein
VPKSRTERLSYKLCRENGLENIGLSTSRSRPGKSVKISLHVSRSFGTRTHDISRAIRSIGMCVGQTGEAAISHHQKERPARNRLALFEFSGDADGI